MPKKHRVKRANYVKHLLAVEEKREAYIEKRKNRKRDRTQRNEEDIFDAARDVAMQAQTKKRRHDPAVEESVKAENPTAHEEASSEPAAPKVNPFASLQAQSGAAVSGGFFDVSQVAPTASATAATAAPEATGAKKKVAAKKKKY